MRKWAWSLSIQCLGFLKKWTHDFDANFKTSIFRYIKIKVKVISHLSQTGYHNCEEVQVKFSSLNAKLITSDHSWSGLNIIVRDPC